MNLDEFPPSAEFLNLEGQATLFINIYKEGCIAVKDRKREASIFNLTEVKPGQPFRNHKGRIGLFLHVRDGKEMGIMEGGVYEEVEVASSVTKLDDGLTLYK